MIAKRGSRRKARPRNTQPASPRPLENPGRESDLIETIADDPSQKQNLRAELQTALEYLREGDVFVVHSIDRLSQNIEDLRRVLQALAGRGIIVEFMKEMLAMNADDEALSRLFVKAIGSVAEFHRAVIGEQKTAEPPPAIRQPARKGRKPALTDDRVVELRKRAAAGEKKVALAREFGISRETLYQYLEAR